MSRRLQIRYTPGRIARGLLRRLAHRSVIRIFAAPTTVSETAVAAGGAPEGALRYELTRLKSDASAADRDRAEAAMRLAGELPGLVRARLAQGDEMFAFQWDGRIVSFSWITYHDRSIGPIRLADRPGRAFSYNGFTAETHRNRGLHTSLLRSMRSALGREGTTELLIDANRHNVASARGIEKAGFVPVGRIAFLTVLNRWRWPLSRTVSCDSSSPLFLRR